MKNKIILIVIIATGWIVLSSHGSKPKPPWEKENVSFPMMNQQIKSSLQEHDRQKDMHENQVLNTGTEAVNNSQWKTFKDVKTKINDRLSFISLTMQAIPTGIAIVDASKQIYNNQNRIIDELTSSPQLAALIYKDEIKFYEDLQMIVRYMTGLVLSYGVVNQMEKADRQILLDYALGEVKKLRNGSSMMLLQIVNAKEKMKLDRAIFRYYVNRDKQITTDVVKRIKNIFG